MKKLLGKLVRGHRYKKYPKLFLINFFKEKHYLKSIFFKKKIEKKIIISLSIHKFHQHYLKLFYLNN